MNKVQGSWKKKLEYFWMYYKIPFIVTVAAVIVIIYFIYAKLSDRPDAIQVLMYDVHTDVSEEQIAVDFAEYAGIDTREYDVFVSTSLLLSDAASENYALTSLSRFLTLIGTEELDACMMLESDFQRYETSAFMDLRELFTEDELADFYKLYFNAQGQVLGVYGEGLGQIEVIGGYEGMDIWLLRQTSFSFVRIYNIVLFVLFLLILMFTLFALIVQARFVNTLGKTIKNGILFCVIHFIKSILMFIVMLIPVILLFVSYRAVSVIVLIGLSGPAYLTSFYFRGLFKDFETS